MNRLRRNMSPRAAWQTLALVLILTSILASAACGSAAPAMMSFPDSPPPPAPAPSNLVALSMASYVTGDAALEAAAQLAPADPEGTQFDVRMRDEAGSGAYAFDPSDLTFDVGDSINFVIESETEFHTFTVEDLDIDASADAGQSLTFNFKFDRAGAFALICIPHETQGMVATITVR